MKKIVNKFLPAGDKFMHELQLRQPLSTWIACGTFTKHYEKIQKFSETRNLKRIYKNKLDKVYFDYAVANSHCKNLVKRTVSGKILKDKTWKIAKS